MAESSHKRPLENASVKPRVPISRRAGMAARPRRASLRVTFFLGAILLKYSHASASGLLAALRGGFLVPVVLVVFRLDGFFAAAVFFVAFFRGVPASPPSVLPPWSAFLLHQWQHLRVPQSRCQPRGALAQSPGHRASDSAT